MRCPKLYGLPKIHKKDTPMRAIVSAFNSSVYKLEQYLASILQLLVEKADSDIKHFIQLLRNLKLDQNDIISSFDVKSLYPSIPVDEALQEIAETENFPTHCLKNAYFMFGNHIYKQTEGAAMGSSLSLTSL